MFWETNQKMWKDLELMIKYAQVQYADTLMQIMEPIFLKIEL